VPLFLSLQDSTLKLSLTKPGSGVIHEFTAVVQTLRLEARKPFCSYKLHPFLVFLKKQYYNLRIKLAI
jgi:hypothetical protein